MFEEQTERLYETMLDRVNNAVSKKPFLSTLLISAFTTIVVIIIALDYRKGETVVEATGVSGDQRNLVSVGLGGEGENRPGKTTDIKVDLAGAVKNPGVYTLKNGSRLGDLLALGGGFVSETSALWVSKNLNLSQTVSDGQKIYIPFDWDIEAIQGGGGVRALSLGVVSEAALKSKVVGELSKMQVGAGGKSELGSSKSDNPASILDPVGGDDGDVNESSESDSPSNLVNVNTATSAELDALPGIGPVYAGRIIENRPYASFEEFKEKSGLSAKLADSLNGLIKF